MEAVRIQMIINELEEKTHDSHNQHTKMKNINKAYQLIIEEFLDLTQN
jgi:hypothetical protein